MPKNTTGGKKFKKVKHTMEFTRPLELPNPDENQEIAYVNKIMGGGTFSLTFIQGGKVAKECLGKICGRLRKRQWVAAGNFVMISIREFDSQKVDIIHVYKDYEMNELKRKGHINPDLIKISNNTDTKGKVSSNLEDEEFADFIDEDEEPQISPQKRYQTTKNQMKGNNITVQDFGLPDFDSEEESEGEPE